LPYLRRIKREKPQLFGAREEMCEADKSLSSFFDKFKPDGDSKVNEEAVDNYMDVWKNTWKNRKDFQLRGHEVKLMKYFHEICGGSDHVHLPELLSMARLIDRETVNVARKVSIPDGWEAKKAFAEQTEVLNSHKKRLFRSRDVTVEACKEIQSKYPEEYKHYQQVVRNRKHAGHLRIIEIFDEEGWFPTVDSDRLMARLKKEGLEGFLPITFRGRLGVQPSGYPLTFYTTSGLELEGPPLNDVVMNENYGKREKGKEYRVHPVKDGTFYCETTAMVGQSKTKYYTLEYKRRGRELKYETVQKLADRIDHVRRRLTKHIHSKHRDTWVRALICLFIDATCARVGNPESAKGKKRTYGVTTLLTKKHVRLNDGEIIISYRGKHDKPQKHKFTRGIQDVGNIAYPYDSLISEKLMALINEGNEHLFTRADGKPYAPQQVNEYFTTEKADAGNGLPEGGAGAPCTVHNLRNYHATKMFVEFAERFSETRKNISYEDVLAAYQGRSKTKRKPGKIGILEKVARKLGNTVSICRKSYIDPKEQFLFFKRWGYRPPESLTRDVFLDEDRRNL
jgi:DNA topoisomerase-1